VRDDAHAGADEGAPAQAILAMGERRCRGEAHHLEIDVARAGAEAQVRAEMREGDLRAEHTAQVQAQRLHVERARGDEARVEAVGQLARPVHVLGRDGAMHELRALLAEGGLAAYAHLHLVGVEYLGARMARRAEHQARGRRAVRAARLPVALLRRVDLVDEAHLPFVPVGVRHARETHAARIPAIGDEHDVIVDLEVPANAGVLREACGRRGEHRERRGERAAHQGADIQR
jgi:hypothetical protein